MLICPHCEQPLTRDGQAYRCQLGHTFDVAREGYVNLLRRPTKLPSDTKEMLAARRRFMDRGYYRPLAEAISATIHEWLHTRGATAEQVASGVLDAGCGEGYFTRAVAQTLATRRTPTVAASDTPPAESTSAVMQAMDDTFRQRQVYGADLSRDAVRLATSYARQAPGDEAMTEQRVVWLVANIKERLPFADASMGAILNVFAPHNAKEFGRLLAPGNLLLVVVPGVSHLNQARERLHLLNIQPDKRSHLLAQLKNDFVLQDEQSLTYDMALDAAAQSDLRMTPQRRTSLDASGTHTAQLALDTPTTVLITSAAFVLLAFARKPL